MKPQRLRTLFPPVKREHQTSGIWSEVVSGNNCAIHSQCTLTVHSQQAQLDLGGLAHRRQLFHVGHLIRLLGPFGGTTEREINRLLSSLTRHNVSTELKSPVMMSQVMKSPVMIHDV